MSDEAPSGEVKPWTVKGVPQEDREWINRAAKRADQPVGPWLISAAKLAVDVERHGMPASYAPADVRPSEASPPASRVGSVEIVERITAVIPGLTTEARGGGQLAALARKVVAQHLRALLLEDGPPAGPPQITQEKQP